MVVVLFLVEGLLTLLLLLGALLLLPLLLLLLRLLLQRLGDSFGGPRWQRTTCVHAH
jgi:hypothetical protein